MSKRRWYFLYVLKTLPPFLLAFELGLEGMEAVAFPEHRLFYGAIEVLNQLSLPTRIAIGVLSMIVALVVLLVIQSWRESLHRRRLEEQLMICNKEPCLHW